MSDLKISFNVNFSVSAVDLLKKSMTTGDIIDEVYENLNAIDYYADQIKEDAKGLRHMRNWGVGDERIFDIILQELNDTPIADLEQFIESHPEQVFCDTDAHRHEEYSDDEIVFGVPCEFDLGDFLACFQRKLERKIEASQKEEMSLDRAKELLGFFVDHECVGENTNTAIQKLLSIGMTEGELLGFGFSFKDIEYAKDSDEEFEI